MKTIYLIGAGALGIRHLEGLLKASTPLVITVIDPSTEALDKAREAAKNTTHQVAFVSDVPKGDVELAIIATTSAHRAAAIHTLLNKCSVKYMVLEKILFTEKKDYAEVGDLLEQKGVRAWVNCPLRLMPVRKDLPNMLKGEAFALHIQGGSRYGLMTNSMHYADYACFLAGSYDFTVDTSLLSPTTLESKRVGYTELSGSLALQFKNGSRGLFTTLPHHAPRRTTVMNKSVRIVLEEPSEKAPILLQRDMTGPLVEEILATGSCGLPTFTESSKVHLQVLEPVKEFLQKQGKTFLYEYPFT